MNPRIILTMSLVAIALLVSCGPVAAPEVTQPALVGDEPQVTYTAVPTDSQPRATLTETLTVEALPTEASTEVPPVVATSRGPNLEATDPSTYTRASGDLQLVEFFAFW